MSTASGPVTLTADGQGADLTGWCECGRPFQIAFGTWAGGSRVGHGFICADCRRLTSKIPADPR